MADVSAASSWGEIYARLLAADRESPLGPEDLARLATAAYLTGREPESAGLWARAHHGFQDRGQPAAAARSAFWLAYGLLDKGELAQGSGWLARARRLLDECGQDCVERGYLLLPEALRVDLGGRLRARRRQPSGWPLGPGIGSAIADPDRPGPAW